jgi:hypothetical protein
MTVVGLVMWERRHAVRPELPSRTLCGIRTGLDDVTDVPGLTEFAGLGEGGLPACRRCLPMWRRVVELKGTVSDPEIAGDHRTYRNGMYIMGLRGAA